MAMQLPVNQRKKPLKGVPGLTRWEKDGNRPAIAYRQLPRFNRSAAQGCKAAEMAQEGWHG